MIDDDTFDKLFRNMIEDFLRNSGMGQNEPSRDSQYRNFRIASEDGVMQIDDVGDPIIEKFEFDDHVLVVIQGCQDETTIAAKAKGAQLLVEFGNGLEQHYEMPFIIDAEESSVSCRNGVVEITIMKSDTEEFDEIVRLLRYV